MEPIRAASVGPRERSRAWRIVVGVVTLGAVAFLVAALRAGLDEVDGSVLPGGGWIAASAVIAVPSVVFAAHSWVALLPRGSDRRRLLRMFYTTQLWRHLPGGSAAQVAGQITLARSSGVPTESAALASPIALLVLLVASACLGATSVVTGLHQIRFAPVLMAGAGSLLLLRRSTFVTVMAFARRWVRRLPDEQHVPSQRALMRSFLWGGGALVMHGAMLAVLLSSSSSTSPLAIISANAVAWALGVLAVPAPSGLGVREGALVALLGGSIPTATLVGAALIQRLVLISAELATVLVVTGASRVRPPVTR
jgi:glycosyltransferase 2 family protein